MHGSFGSSGSSHSRWCALGALSIVTACTSTPAPEPGAIVGPLVGHVTESTAALWVYGGPQSRFEVEVVDAESGERAACTATPLVFEPDGPGALAATITVGDLRPRTRYRYRITPLHDPSTHPAGAPGHAGAVTGEFTTAPPRDEPGRFTVTVASCIKTRPSRQSAWPHLLALHPAFQLLLGDNAYVNSTRPRRIWSRNLAVRSMPNFADVIRRVPTYAIWDDHDYAGNNRHGRASGKERALREFRQLWANPGAGTDDVPGVFYSFCWGDVEFFMLDGRYHRTPSLDPQRQWILGEGQFAWLADALERSTSTFKVLACGSTLGERGTDCWYDGARDRLFRLLAERGVEGALFLSGDVHYSAIRTHPLTETGGYELTEVISSGIANSAALSFASLEFDTTAPDPTVRIRIIDGRGAVRDERIVRRSDLCWPRAEASVGDPGGAA